MIDLHCHVLPGVDDGPGTLEGSLELARAAAADGTTTLVATPHVSSAYPTTAHRMETGVESLNRELIRVGVPIEVLPGAEVAPALVAGLPDSELERLRLGDGRHLLLEAPLEAVGTELEETIRGLQGRGYGILLAHPERCPSFHRDPDRLARLVAHGVLCSITAASLAGRSGGPVQRLAVELLKRGLAHNVASDAHDAYRRPPLLRSLLRSAGGKVPGLAVEGPWFTDLAPRAILTGEPLPPRGRRAAATRSFRRRAAR